MAQSDPKKAAARSWLSREQRAVKKAARPVLMLHVIGTAFGVGQAFAAAAVLSAAFAGSGIDITGLAVFGILALLRAGLSYLTDKAAFAAGAAARRRLRSDAMSRLLQVLKEGADLVVLDCSRAAAGPEAGMLAHLCDATLLVTRKESLGKMALSKSVSLLTGAHAAPLAIIATK